MEGPLGKTLDNTYRIDLLLGKGGMGTVYRAHDTTLDRDVALKILYPNLTEEEDFRARFLQEARAIAALDHPGIVRVHAFGQDMGLLYIVMDFVPGQTLHDWLKRLADEQKIVALSESLIIARRIALALHYAHEEGVLHRDIKPANILLKPTPAALREPGDLPFHPVVTDFGLAKLAEGGIQTRTGATMGTPAYMSPEQCLGRDPDRRSDVYSLGVVLFELTTGRVPFEVKSLTEAIRCHTQEPPPPPRSVNPSLPLEVENIVLRALAKRQEERFSSAREMADALRTTIPHIPQNMMVAPTHAQESGPYASLVTRLEQAGVGQDASGQQADTRGQLVEGTLTIVSADGQSRRLSLRQRRAWTVGRAEGNDVCITGANVSRRHVRIEFDGQRFTLMDLDSTNGTFLGDSQLLPGVPEVWTPDKILRVGDNKLHLEQTQQLRQAQVPVSSGETAVGLNLRMSGSIQDRISVSMDTFDLTVEPGGTGTISFTALNQATVVDHYQISVEGVPRDWVPDLPPLIRVLPGEEEEVNLVLQPPRSPQSRAGGYPVTIHVTSQDDPGQVASVKGNLTLTPYYQFSFDMRPQKQTGLVSGTFELQLGNQGNASLNVNLSAADPEDGCSYTLPSPVVVAAGEEERVQLIVRPKAALPGETDRTYPFTVTARPVEAPEQARQMQGQWVQITPTFEASIRPQRQNGTTKGAFVVRISNRSAADLQVELEATDPEDACRYTFQPAQLVVRAGQEGGAQLSVQPRMALPGETEKPHLFTVTARLMEAASMTRQVQGQWVQVAPTFELGLQPAKQSGRDSGSFGVRVINHTVADLEVALEAADAEAKCEYTIEPPRVSLSGSQERTVRLTVRPKRGLRSQESQSYPFTVTARPAGAPRVTRQVQGEWVQMPRLRSLWMPALFLIAGWVIAWLLFAVPLYEFVFEYVIPWAQEMGVLPRLVRTLVWALRGAIAGIVGGLATGLALKWAVPSFSWKRVLGMGNVWGIGWAMGAAAAPLTGLPFEGDITAIVFWAVVGAIVGMIAGLVTGQGLHKAEPSVTGGHVFVIGLGWAIAWAVGEILLEWMVQFGMLEELGTVHWIAFGVVLGTCGGVIGSAFTFGLLHSARRRSA